MKLASIVGARPNFVKLAAIHSTLRSFSEHIIIHTGQHYDYRLSEIFFKELDLPEPDFKEHLVLRSEICLRNFNPYLVRITNLTPFSFMETQIRLLPVPFVRQSQD